MLVWHERIDDDAQASQRERTMKEWPRDWKINVVERANPNWTDLGPSLRPPEVES